ncbi:hypothetical protein V6N13_019827 [Hibiscus sabdariffa]|uniref:Uncharacterized protein n=1 Tax=Hibiscus sabdariffa TaxID=183260 RepID=A0ABR2EVL4_9ROSI
MKILINNQQIQKIREVVNLEVGASTYEVCANEIGFSDYSANRVGITGEEIRKDSEIDTIGNKSELSCSSEENRSKSSIEEMIKKRRQIKEMKKSDINWAKLLFKNNQIPNELEYEKELGEVGLDNFEKEEPNDLEGNGEDKPIVIQKTEDKSG